MHSLRAVAAALVVAGCYQFDPPSGVFACRADSECPGAQRCGVDGRCHHPSELPDGGERPPDGGLAGSDARVTDARPPPAVTCGDQRTEGNESCDDGDRAPGDGCDANCQVELGWACSGMPSVCAETCGDGRRDATEECDDGGNEPDDGCSRSCALEEGWTCDGDGCRPVCGDGITAGLEGCDDGGRVAGDGCDARCDLESGYSCAGGRPSVCTDVDECAAGTASCPARSSCVNERGSYRCDCDCGYRPEAAGCVESRASWPASVEQRSYDARLSLSSDTVRAIPIDLPVATRLRGAVFDTNTFGVDLVVGLYREAAGAPGAFVAAASGSTVLGQTQVSFAGCSALPPGRYWLVWNQRASVSFDSSAADIVSVRTLARSYSLGLPGVGMEFPAGTPWSSTQLDIFRVFVVTE